jgi:hypothetical protein
MKWWGLGFIYMPILFFIPKHLQAEQLGIPKRSFNRKIKDFIDYQDDRLMQVCIQKVGRK